MHVIRASLQNLNGEDYREADAAMSALESLQTLTGEQYRLADAAMSELELKLEAQQLMVAELEAQQLMDAPECSSLGSEGGL